MINDDIAYLIKIQNYRSRGYNVIENVPFEIEDDTPFEDENPDLPIKNTITKETH